MSVLISEKEEVKMDLRKDRVPIIIPAYEPSSRLLELCESLLSMGMPDVIIVDDGSDGEYRQIFDEIKNKYHFTILRHAINQGKGRALKTAYNYILSECPDIVGVVTADSDGQHTVEDIKRIIDALVANPERMILGCRVFDGEDIPWKSRFGNKVTSKVFRYLCGIKLSDTQTGLRGIPKSLAEKSLLIKGERFDYETNVLLNSNDEYEFMEIPIETVYESKKDHKTHFDPLKDSLMIYRLIISYTLSSLLSVVIDFTIFTLLMKSGSNVWLATAVGRLGSTITNFTINRKVVFKAEGNIFRQLFGYLLLVLVSGTTSALLINLLSKLFAGYTIIWKALVESFLFFFNYYIQRSFVFSKKKRRKQG